ncbi:MAG: hypothetical protein RL701_3048 [Pseudomonadota bacterium]|jgi:hypothetical protein
MVAWVTQEAERRNVSVSSVFSQAVTELRRRLAADKLLASGAVDEPLSDAMYAFHHAEQNGTDPDVLRVGDAWGRVALEHDANAYAAVKHYAQERLAGRATPTLVAATLARLAQLTGEAQ